MGKVQRKGRPIEGMVCGHWLGCQTGPLCANMKRVDPTVKHRLFINKDVHSCGTNKRATSSPGIYSRVYSHKRFWG